MKIAIVGSRSIQDYKLVKTIIDEHKHQITEIISGGAIGVDACAAKYAKENKIKLTEYEPNYAVDKGSAPIIRNMKIVNYSEGTIAIWDGLSAGSRFTIDYARKQKKLIQVYKV
jgi:predicted Rossmann fold nucleotide-binding protein DprA/Smf involved in DNA uptake